MIYLVDGPPGAGKSYFCVCKIADALAAGKVVITNVPLSDDWAERVARMNPVRRWSKRAVAKRAAYYRSRVLVTKSLDEAMRVRVAGREEGRAVMVLDEAHQWLNARNWGDGDRQRVVMFFSAHRHLGFDIYLVSQNIEDIDKQVRNRVEYRVRLRNIKRQKVAGVSVIPFNLFAAIYELHASKTGAITKRDFRRLQRSIARMYSTHGLADEDVPENVIWLPTVDQAERGGTREAGTAPATDPETQQQQLLRTHLELAPPPRARLTFGGLGVPPSDAPREARPATATDVPPPADAPPPAATTTPLIASPVPAVRATWPQRSEDPTPSAPSEPTTTLRAITSPPAPEKVNGAPGRALRSVTPSESALDDHRRT